MSDVTVLASCDINEEAEKLCKLIEEFMQRRLDDVVIDDWRRPIVDGILSSLIYYNKVDLKKIRQILEILGYKELYEPLKKAYKYTMFIEEKEQIIKIAELIEPKIFQLAENLQNA